MKRSVKRGDSGSGRGVGIDVRAAYTAYRIRRAVLFMVGVENEENI